MIQWIAPIIHSGTGHFCNFSKSCLLWPEFRPIYSSLMNIVDHKSIFSLQSNFSFLLTSNAIRILLQHFLLMSEEMIGLEWSEAGITSQWSFAVLTFWRISPWKIDLHCWNLTLEMKESLLRISFLVTGGIEGVRHDSSIHAFLLLIAHLFVVVFIHFIFKNSGNESAIWSLINSFAVLCLQPHIRSLICRWFPSLVSLLIVLFVCLFIHSVIRFHTCLFTLLFLRWWVH
jgi:hypothetical protein